MISLEKPVVLAAVAHPDDIEFCFGGTLLLLREAGCSIHMWNLADGCCGTMQHSRSEIACIRAKEASNSAALAGAVIHPPLFHDLEVFYDRPSLQAVGSVVRTIRPNIILTHSPNDYMEDHQNVCRLIVSAAFSRGIPNFFTEPATQPYRDSLRIYHGAPHGLTDGLETPFKPRVLIDISSTMDRKRRMLDCHESQRSWLESTQGMDGMVGEMEYLCRAMASWGENISYAEAWRRHSHLGFCPYDFDPLPELLKEHSQNITD